MPEINQDQATTVDQQVSAPATPKGSFDKDLAVSVIATHIDVERLEKLLAQARLKHQRASVRFASIAYDAGLTQKTIVTRMPFSDDYWVLYVDGDGDVTCTQAVDQVDE